VQQREAPVADPASLQSSAVQCGGRCCSTPCTCTEAACQLACDAVAFAGPGDERASRPSSLPRLLTVCEEHSLTRLGTPVVVCLAGVLLGALMMRASPVPSLAECTLSIALSGEGEGPGSQGQESVPQQRRSSLFVPTSDCCHSALPLPLALDTLESIAPGVGPTWRCASRSWVSFGG